MTLRHILLDNLLQPPRLLPWYCKNKKMAYCRKLLGIAFVD